MSEAPRSSVLPPPDNENELTDFVCPNCGYRDKGKYCSNCGQKEIHEEDLSVAHAWHHIVHEAVHVDGKIFTTLKLLLTRPGQLTLDFWMGRRARHVHPIRLFLLLGVGFFFFAHVNSPIKSLVILTPETVTNIGPLKNRILQAGKTPVEFADDFNARAEAATKPIWIGILLLQGFSLWLLFRAQRPYLAEHMVMALHLTSFGMLVWMVFGWGFLWGVPRSITQDAVSLATTIYFLFSARRTYGGSWGVLLWRWLGSCILSGMMLAIALIVSVLLFASTHY